MVVRPMKSAEKCLTSFRLENIDFPHFHVRVRAEQGDERLLLFNRWKRTELAIEENTPRKNESTRKVSRTGANLCNFRANKILYFLSHKKDFSFPIFKGRENIFYFFS